MALPSRISPRPEKRCGRPTGPARARIGASTSPAPSCAPGTARAAQTVIYTRRKVPPPDITLETVTPLLEGDREGPPVPINPAGPLIVTWPRVRVSGRIVGREALSRAERYEGDPANARSLD